MKEKVEVLNFLDDNNNILNLTDDELGALDSFKASEGKQKGNVVCFSGSRPADLPWKYNEDCQLCFEFKRRLNLTIKKLISLGYTSFISGMALGFDTMAAECVLALKNEGYKISLECAIGCENQYKEWNSEQQERYLGILSRADKVTIVFNEYFPGCFLKRNEYMVESSALVVAYPTKQKGGTAYTIEYAKKKNLKIIVLK